MIRLLFIYSHPVPYRNHIFDKLSKENGLVINVLYWENPDPLRGLDKNINLEHNHTYLVHSLVKTYKEIKLFKPDLIIIGGLITSFALLTIFYSRIKKIKYGIHSESVDLKKRNLFKTFVRDLIYKFLLKEVNIIYPTSTLALKFLRKYSQKPRPYCFFPNSPDHIEFNKAITSIRNGNIYPVWQEPLKVLYVGRLVKLKGLDILLNAWKICELSVKNIELILLGDGSERKRLEELAEELELKHVTFLGSVDNKETLKYYAQSHLFVLPSIEEPYGAVVNEAISAGLPIILSNSVGCQKDTLIEGKNGFLFTNGDSSKLAERIIYILSYKGEWVKMCIESLSISEKFKAEIIINELLSTIKLSFNSN